MKKRLFLFSGMVFILAIGITSCKKDYSCTCTVKDSNGNLVATSSVSINDTKSKATSTCNGIPNTFVSSGNSTETETCTIQ